MSARDRILARLREKLAQGTNETDRQQAVDTRLAETPRGIIPLRGQLPPAERIALFLAMAEKAAASTARLAAMSDVPGEVAHYLKAKNLPATIRMGNDPLLATANFEAFRQLSVSYGPSDGNDLSGLSHAVAAIAESGTLLLASGPDNPTTLNFLPEHHIVVVRAEDVDGDMETALARLRAHYGKGEMPRAANLVTGPSRSGDIEQQIILGAHGPRALHIIVVG